jgi:hypothetical protein
MKQNKKAKNYAVFCFAEKKKLLFYIYAVIVKQFFYKRSTNHYLPPLHMYCRSVLSSCRRETAQCGAVRSGATTRPNVFEEQPELKALPLLMKCEKASPCNPFTRGLSPLNVPN